MSYLGTTKIGKMYLGNTEIGKAYLGTALVFQKGGSPTPPTPSAIPYVRGGVGGSYIDTGITPDNTVKVIVWARNLNPGVSTMWLFGSRNANVDKSFTVSVQSGTLTGGIRIGFGDANFDVADKFTLLSNYHKYELDGNVFKVDDTVVTTATSATFSNSHNIHLFGINNGGSHASPAQPIDICAAQIYKGGVLVRDYTPVDSPSVGFYDAVSETVFTNAGNDSFTYGSFDMTGYTPLEYVECTATAYFDTGIYGSYNLPIVTKFRPGGTTPAFRNLLGARTSSSSGRCEFQIGNSTDLNKTFAFNYQTASNMVYQSASQTGNDLVWTKSNNVSTLYKNGSQLGTKTGATGTSFTTSYTMYIGAMNNAGSVVNGFLGRLYFIGFGASANYVPMSYNGVAGFYDTYNDTFHASASANPFVAGTTL